MFIIFAESFKLMKSAHAHTLEHIFFQIIFRQNSYLSSSCKTSSRFLANNSLSRFRVFLEISARRSSSRRLAASRSSSSSCNFCSKASRPPAKGQKMLNLIFVAQANQSIKAFSNCPIKVKSTAWDS